MVTPKRTGGNKVKKLPPAQLRVLRICARAKANGYHWWRLVYRHDGLIFRKLIERGYIENGVEKRRLVTGNGRFS